ncbi:hypothetical protein IIV22_066L [Invertebrate iridescent virus 22]|uniref:Uncharacterized protein n=1 Tax=Invertebrate iridescent virus 22 TaxID=345198 RepID=S6DA62_9VIRU|nr:hypothetical protein IIV22_066L [Invertebrate iridescent virus 22]CCV01743.1 hypothetical protein IIV22_066L [Invertebrate iridescent virus 22]
MKQVVLLLQTILLCTLSNAQHSGSTCQLDSDCDSWLSCINGLCTSCAKAGNICEPGATTGFFKCCDGSNTTCELIPGRNNTSQCMPNNNNCRTNADCSYGLSCLMRLGKCGLCHPNGEKCTLPYDTLECCSSYCRIGVYIDGSGMCADPRHYPLPTTTTENIHALRNIDIHDVVGDVVITPAPIASFVPNIYNNDDFLINRTTTTEAPRPCVDGNQCGINMCIDGLCTKCQNINTLCEVNSDCCQSKYNSIICAVANHQQHVVGYHIYNKKICTMEF